MTVSAEISLRRLFLAIASLFILDRLLEGLGLPSLVLTLTLLILAAGAGFYALRPRQDSPDPNTIDKADRWLIDTSALVDGRILVLVERGLGISKLVLSPEVLAELQSLADRSDRRRRDRGRRGLEIAASLREKRPDMLSEPLALEDGSKTQDVDELLLAAALAGHGRIVSADAGLLRRAEAAGLPVLDLHALARDLRVAAAPGDRMSLELVRAGRSKDQAIAYQEDGCMVVVEGGKDQIGAKVEVEVISSLTTRNGPLIFARCLGLAKDEGDQNGKGA